jgi:lycopene beta-cyclase
VAILGAGLSGLSLACALLEAGVSEPIVLIDRRTTWERDRTWCTWASESMRFGELAGHRWAHWRITAGGAEALGGSSRRPYVHLDARDVYRTALDRLAAAPNVELRTGETVLGVSADRDQAPVITTRTGTIDASTIFDALGPGSPLLSPPVEDDVELVQSFLGWEVELEVPRFDPRVATLMDFRPDGRAGLRFLYVLPFSSTRALIEDTSIGRMPVPPAERRRMLAQELRDGLGVDSWQVLHEERGRIPMSTRRFALQHGPHVHAVGAAAGAIRPSSGYAFSRIQRHCTQVARAHAGSRPFPTRLAPRRTTALDTIFLRALAAEPDGFPEIFLRLTSAVPGDTFARFMTDESSPWEDAHVIGALPKGPFLSALLGRSGPVIAATLSGRRHGHGHGRGAARTAAGLGQPSR